MAWLPYRQWVSKGYGIKMAGLLPLTGREPSQYPAVVKSLSLTCACCRPESPGGRRGHGLALQVTTRR
jgi:hypothetical protein